MKLIKRDKYNIISIDGKDGSGKSTLAKYLATNLGVRHFKLDDDRYLIKNRGKYVNFIKYEILKSDIIECLSRRRKIILDSICILQILENLNLKADIKIYVKKLIHGYHWFDGEKFDYSRNVEGLLDEEEKNLKRFIEMEAELEGRGPDPFKPEESIFHEIIRYHFKYQPDLKLDIIFERMDE